MGDGGDGTQAPVTEPGITDPTRYRTRSQWRDFNRMGRRGMGDGGDATQAPIISPGTDGDANIDRRPRRRHAPVDTSGLMRTPAPTTMTQAPPLDSSPVPRGDSSARGGRVRAAKGDPSDETLP